MTWSSCISIEIAEEIDGLSGVYVGPDGRPPALRRAVCLWRPPQHARARGADASRSKFTAADVLAIRARLAAGKRGIGVKLAAEYGVTTAAICRIGKRLDWAHLPEAG